jgi:molybdate transport system substrate-binding protein
VRQVFSAIATVAFAISAAVCTAADTNQPLLIFAAASLTDAITEIDAGFSKETGIAIKPSFAASSVLAKQIEAGAPADVFFPADEDWMDYLEKHVLLSAGTRRDVLANQLVLVAPADSSASVKISSGASLLAGIGDSRIATGDPDSVPVGKYAKAALTTLGVWDQLAPRLVRAESVRSALFYVAHGEAPFGIVYLTDAKVEKKVKLLDTFPESTYPPIRYPVALTAKADPRARRFVNYLTSKSASTVFEKYGFSIVH